MLCHSKRVSLLLLSLTLCFPVGAATAAKTITALAVAKQDSACHHNSGVYAYTEQDKVLCRNGVSMRWKYAFVREQYLPPKAIKPASFNDGCHCAPCTAD